MTVWVKLDATWYDQANVIELGPAARDLYQQMRCYCKVNLTDGVMSDPQMSRLGIKKVAVLVSKLTSSGFLERTQEDSGWFITGWFDDNRPAAEIAEISRKRATAGSRGGSKRKANRKQIASNLLYPETEVETEVETETKPPPPTNDQSASDDKLPGGGGSGDESKTAGGPARAVVDDALARLGIVDIDPPTLGELRAVQRCLEIGHPPAELQAIADQSIASGADKPRAWVFAAWNRMANEPPERPQSVTHDDNCCGGTGLVEDPDTGAILGQCSGTF